MTPLSHFPRAFASNARCIKPWTDVARPASEQKTDAIKWRGPERHELSASELVKAIRNGR